METLICIDDTDNLESRGTGKLASQLAEELEQNGWARCRFVTRHQLFVHPDVPYTSHNSTMCFAADVKASAFSQIIAYASAFLVRESATGSDPGLCVAIRDQLSAPQELIDYGREAKKRVLTKTAAFEMARRHGIHLSEHGGTGDGVIGALAGIGLRLSGNDGRLRGKLHIENDDGTARVRDILSQVAVREVRSLCGKCLDEDTRIQLGEKVKAVYLDYGPVLLVSPAGNGNGGPAWQTCSKEELKIY